LILEQSRNEEVVMVAHDDRVTMYGVQAFRKQGERLVPDAPRIAPSEAAAVGMARDLAHTRAGVIAWCRSGDRYLGEFDDPVILAEHGEVPARDAF
jgi:hypothetical protein